MELIRQSQSGPYDADGERYIIQFDTYSRESAPNHIVGRIVLPRRATNVTFTTSDPKNIRFDKPELIPETIKSLTSKLLELERTK